MGYAKRGLYNEEYSIYNFNTSEFICNRHIREKFINKHIKKTGALGKCDYCNRKTKVVPLSDVLEIIVTGIDFYYEDPVNSRNLSSETESGFDGDNMCFEEMWESFELEFNDNIWNFDKYIDQDIFRYLNNSSYYCDKEEFFSELDYSKGLWNLFKDVVKHKARYVFHFKNTFGDYYYDDPIKIMENVQKVILDLDLFFEIQDKEILYRCRQHKEGEVLDKASDFASVPTKFAKQSGRMNAAGISIFYSSPDKKLTIQEVVNESDMLRRKYSIAEFKTNKQIKLLNLVDLPKTPSCFDKENNVKISSIEFLKSFVEDVIKPINKEDEGIEYIPTQIFTEYIRFNPDLKVEGIRYPSSKQNDKYNIVLFYDHKKSLEELEFIEDSITLHSMKKRESYILLLFIKLYNKLKILYTNLTNHNTN